MFRSAIALTGEYEERLAGADRSGRLVAEDAPDLLVRLRDVLERRHGAHTGFVMRRFYHLANQNSPVRRLAVE